MHVMFVINRLMVLNKYQLTVQSESGHKKGAEQGWRWRLPSAHVQQIL